MVGSSRALRPREGDLGAGAAREDAVWGVKGKCSSSAPLFEVLENRR